MAIYHLSVKPVSRSSGRSSTAAAAYRSGSEITDSRTGKIHDYTRKAGVEHAEIVLPDNAPDWAHDRAQLWNAAEQAEKRKDACVAREYEVALPSELSPEERKRLALDFAKDIANRNGCAADVAIHEPGKEGDNRNHHAHILTTTRKVETDGLGEKCDIEKAGRNRKADLENVRERWTNLTNQRLHENGSTDRIDHKTLKAQGIDRTPTVHLGPTATTLERRGIRTDLGDINRRIEAAHNQWMEERHKLDSLNPEIINLDASIEKALADCYDPRFLRGNRGALSRVNRGRPEKQPAELRGTNRA